MSDLVKPGELGFVRRYAAILLAIQRALPEGYEVHCTSNLQSPFLEFALRQASSEHSLRCLVTPKEVASWSEIYGEPGMWREVITPAGQSGIPIYAAGIAEELRTRALAS